MLLLTTVHFQLNAVVMPTLFFVFYNNFVYLGGFNQLHACIYNKVTRCNDTSVSVSRQNIDLSTAVSTRSNRRRSHWQRIVIPCQLDDASRAALTHRSHVIILIAVDALSSSSFHPSPSPTPPDYLMIAGGSPQTATIHSILVNDRRKSRETRS